MTIQFSVTEKAAQRITDLLASENSAYFRVRVDGGGCAGFQYKFEFDDQPAEDDRQFSAHGITVLVDAVSLDFLGDAQLDFVDELLGAYFKIENPNATAACGCGTSFAV
jgi:iron-sulfur cluster insertion protein